MKLIFKFVLELEFNDFLGLEKWKSKNVAIHQ